MPATVTALVIALLGVLPGGLYTWALEQQAGRWGTNATDRLQRFAGASAIFLVLELPLIYECYRRFGVTRQLSEGRALPPWVWLLPIALVAVPLVLGRVAGRAAYQRRGWVRFLTGPSPAPRAWDHLFAQAELNGWLLVKLKGGTWLGGLWGTSDATQLTSYAAGYPEVQDLLIAEAADVDDSGHFVLDANGMPTLQGVAALVRWDEVDYAVFVPG